MKVETIGEVWAVCFVYSDESEGVVAVATSEAAAEAWGAQEIARMKGRRAARYIPSVKTYMLDLVEGK